MRICLFLMLVITSSCAPRPTRQGDEYVLVEFAGKLEEESETFKKLQD